MIKLNNLLGTKEQEEVEGEVKRNSIQEIKKKQKLKRVSIIN